MAHSQKSLLEHHVAPVDVVDVALLVGHCRKRVRVVGPEDPLHLLRQLDTPLDLLPHSVEDHHLAAVEQHQSTALAVELGVPFLLQRELRHIHAQHLVVSEVLLELHHNILTLKKLKQALTWMFHHLMVPS